MMQLMDDLTDKPAWEVKVFDSKMLSEWRDEALTCELIGDAAGNGVVQELQVKGEVFQTAS